MKKLLKKDIDFNNKEICATEYHFAFNKKERPEGWNIEDEIMMLTLYLQQEIVAREVQTPIHTIMDWRKNVSVSINKTLDKIEGSEIFRDTWVTNWQEDYLMHETYCTDKNFNGQVLEIVGINKTGFPELTDTGKADLEKEQMLMKAKELAKAELLREQEEARLEEEVEEEAEDVDIVIPFRNYGK